MFSILPSYPVAGWWLLAVAIHPPWSASLVLSESWWLFWWWSGGQAELKFAASRLWPNAETINGLCQFCPALPSPYSACRTFSFSCTFTMCSNWLLQSLDLSRWAYSYIVSDAPVERSWPGQLPRLVYLLKTIAVITLLLTQHSQHLALLDGIAGGLANLLIQVGPERAFSQTPKKK